MKYSNVIRILWGDNMKAEWDKIKVRDILDNPIGADLLHDLLRELKFTKHEKIIFNPLINNLKLKNISKMTNMIDEDLIKVICDKMNIYEKETLPTDRKNVQRRWWKECVCYQIYPRSFYDSNADGVGDIRGIIEKLDYLSYLGIDVIWLSPIYDSPNDDNGYDIRDYYKIMGEFGTMDDFDTLLAEVHKRGMKLIMDLVINHTSDEHEWFKQASNDQSSKYHNYYIWKEGKDGNQPNNWRSLFEGSAWEYNNDVQKYYLHLFTKKQVDLNWDNIDAREDIYSMINWWLDKGIDGFRLDVINIISKQPGLPNGCDKLAEITGFTGLEHYIYGPYVHNYIQELYKKTFSKYDVMTVGECIGVGLEMSKYFIHEDRNELNMVFSFEHMNGDGKSKWEDYRYDLNNLRDKMIRPQLAYGNSCWNTVFMNNHDNPRMISKILKDNKNRDVLAKLLATLNLTFKGTPYIYQGQEIGMMNPVFNSLDDFRDVESLNIAKSLFEKGKVESEVLNNLRCGSRDNSRSPISWNDSDNAGFSVADPWINICPDYKAYNVESQLKRKNSILSYYRELIRLRKERVELIYGDFILDIDRKDILSYRRCYENKTVYIVMNLSEDNKSIKYNADGKLILTNYEDIAYNKLFRPYEVRVYEC